MWSWLVFFLLVYFIASAFDQSGEIDELRGEIEELRDDRGW